MTSGRTYVDYLADILDAIDKVGVFIEGMTLETFAKDDKTIFAVIRALEIIGEATKRLPQTIRDQYSDVPWRQMVGMLDKLTHDYIGVHIVVVWKTATEDLPDLEQRIRRIVREIDGT